MPDLPSNEPDTLPPGILASPSCPPLALLRAWQEQVLPSDLADEISSHLDSCSICRTLLADLQQLPQPALTSAERQRIHRHLPLPISRRRSHTSWHWYAAASAAAAMILFAIFLMIRQVRLSEPAQAISAPAPSPAAAPPHPLEPQIAKLAPPLESSPGLVLRGAQSTAQPSSDQLAFAFTAYEANDYSTAIERFSRLVQRYPRAGTPLLYLGVSELLAGENASALVHLTHAEEFASPSQRDAAAWYRALAAVRNHAPDAGQVLRALCTRDDSSYAQQACQLERTRHAQ